MEKSIAVSGINGFVGGHLYSSLRGEGVKVIGVGREDNCEHTDEYHRADLAEGWPDQVTDVDAIIHLAGLAATGPSFDNPQTYINLNSAMVTHMCEHFLRQEKKPRIIIVSSGAIYDPFQPLPITETGKLSLSSPYAVSKVLVENQAEYYRSRGLDCTIVRPFNHIGPGQLSGFIVPDFYEKISSAEHGATVKVGNIDTRRDYTDVRDIVKAYTKLALASALEQPIYNVCSGKSYSGKEIFELVQKAINREDVSYEVDPSLIRPNDPAEIVGDSQRLQGEVGWNPSIDIQQTIEDFVSDKTI